MKNKIKIFIAIVLLMTTLVSCWDWVEKILVEGISTNMASWDVINNTDRELYLTIPSQTTLGFDGHIMPGETIRLITIRFNWRHEYDFYAIEELLPHYNPLSLYLKEGDVLLYTWTIEEKDDPGKQFFNESSWTVETIKEGRERIWTFEINPEDLP